MSGPSAASSSERTISLVCLGTGHGGSMVYSGICSSAYVLCVDKVPVLLVGAGYGVVQQCLRYFGRIPSDVFVTSNRSHMAAELPVLLAVEANRRDAPLRVLGHPTVLQRIEGHRLAELQQVMELRGDATSSLVDLCPVLACDVCGGGSDAFDHAEGVVLRDAPGISVRSIVTQTTECSAGVAIYCAHSGGLPLYAITGDASDACQLLAGSLKRFHCVVVDGRRERSSDHPSFADLEAASSGSSGRHLGRLHKWFVGHYGGPQEAPMPSGHPGAMQPVVEGMLVHVHYRVTLRTQDLPRHDDGVDDGQLGSSACVVDVQVTLLKDLLPSDKPRTGSASGRASAGDDGGDALLPPTKRRSRDVQVRARPPKAMGVAAACGKGEATAINGANGAPMDAAMPLHRDSVRQRSSSPLLRLQQPTASSARRNSSSRRASDRRASPLRGGADGSVADPILNEGAAPKRVYLFSNEDKNAPGLLLMAQVFRTMQQLKLKAGEMLGIRPVGELYAVPSGVHLTSVEQLTHGSCVIVTKSGGEMFSMSRLPKALRHRTKTAPTANNAAAAHHSPTSKLSPMHHPHRDRHHDTTEERTDSSPLLRRQPPPGASPHVTSQFSDFMAQASAILSSADRQVSVLEPRAMVDHAASYRSNAARLVVAGALPVGSSAGDGDADAPLSRLDTMDSSPLLSEQEEDDIFGERRGRNGGRANNASDVRYDTGASVSARLLEERSMDNVVVAGSTKGTEGPSHQGTTRRKTKKVFAMVSL